jgi:hypothetical protein
MTQVLSRLRVAVDGTEFAALFELFMKQTYLDISS